MSLPSRVSSSALSTFLNVTFRPAPKMPFAGDDEAVVERRAQHHDLVEARAAVDADRRIDRVIDGVGAGAAVDLGFALHRQVERHEGAHDELVVVRLAFEPEGSLVVIDVEGVFTAAAEYRGRMGDAVAHVGDAVQRQAQVAW